MKNKVLGLMITLLFIGSLTLASNIQPVKATGIQEALTELIGTIETWNLPKGTENSLTPKLEDALHLLAVTNENGAIHKLIDFINQVEALREKKLLNWQADYLVSEAQRIIDLITDG